MAGAPALYLYVEDVVDTRRHKTVVYSVRVVAADTPDYTSGGEPLDFTLAVNPNGLGRAGVPSNPLPTGAEILPGPPTLGWHCSVEKNGSSPTLKNYLFRLWNGATEEASGYTSGIYGNTLGVAPKFWFSVRVPRSRA